MHACSRRIVIAALLISTTVAAGACAQAAAVLHARDIAEVARDWALARGVTVEPNADVDRAAVRAAYAEAGGTVGS